MHENGNNISKATKDKLQEIQTQVAYEIPISRGKRCICVYLYRANRNVNRSTNRRTWKGVGYDRTDGSGTQNEKHNINDD